MVTSMKRKPTSKPIFSTEEIANALAAASEVPVEDRDNPRTTPADWEGAVASQSLSELREKLAARHRGPGRAPHKIPTTIRFDADVLDALRASGKGWQTRVNEVMKEWLKDHTPA